MRRSSACPHILREGHFKRVVVDGTKIDYDSLHKYLRRRFRKPGHCQSCGREKPLDWALRPDAPGYTRSIGDYYALCRQCHNRMDFGHEDLGTWIGVRNAA